jgi:hypothetical protein
MADVVEVTTRLGDTVIAIAHGSSLTFGETGEVFAPVPTTTVSIDTVVDHAISAGLVTIEIRRVAASLDHVPRKRAEGRPAAYVAISLFVHLALWGTSMYVGPGESRGVGAGRHAPMAWALSTTPEHGHVIDEENSDIGVSMNLPDRHEGSAPRADAAAHDVTALDRPLARDEAERRRAAIESARSAGILAAALDDARSGANSSDLTDIYGSIDGDAHGEVTGAMAIDTSFAGERRLGGGCRGDDCGTIAAGDYKTVHDHPTQYGTCGGTCTAHIRGRVSAVPTIHLCGHPDRPGPSPCVAIIGDLDKSIIRRYIRRQLGAIQYCYERALLASAELGGTLHTEFVIDATGTPRDITTSGVHPDVASCVATVIGSIKFPAARNGGFTKVVYPFELRLAGS